ncbi:hypothetical protein ONA70_12880 [Micromonospora yasonensis]|uniref:hypothetical protein n=1 Tax=Micromonospora yasonensis TaxID=1128667 RepID=UPI00222E9181|nr:hypothetical protein [Micromonospora yasonensis]MCW3840994.1 hypothetical protein [Micromonospora yasonensis]
MQPQPGDLLRIDGRASVQFAGDRALTLRVVSVGPELTYTGWVWLTGYVIDRRGQAVERRKIFVQIAGLRRAATVPSPSRSRATRPHASRRDQGDGRAARDGSGVRTRAEAR